MTARAVRHRASFEVAVEEQIPRVQVMPLTGTVGAVDSFVAYAHEDEGIRGQVEQHLAALRRIGRLNVWHDRKIMPGSTWETEISSALDECGLVLLVVSPAFIASDYCYGVEMQRALALRAEGRCVIVPIIARPCLWQPTPLGAIQALPTDARPITTWENQDSALLDVTNGIAALLDSLKPKPTVTGDETYSPSALVSLRINSLFRTAGLPANSLFFLTPDHAFLTEGFMMFFLTTDANGVPTTETDMVLHVLEGDIRFETEGGPITQADSYSITPTGRGSNYRLKGRGFSERVSLRLETPLGTQQREIFFSARQ